MGDHNVTNLENAEEKRAFTKCLLNDIEALEIMLSKRLFENDIVRIGAEQEVALAREDWTPALKFQEILDQINDSDFTTELAQFNLEINLAPLEFKGSVFSQLQSNLEEKVAVLRKAAHNVGSKVLLTGIMPTITPNHLQFNCMTPNPRYEVLNQIILERRNSNIELNLKGIDELVAAHSNILYEACNTSFQVHLQINQDDFVDRYNWSQLIAAPVQAIAANSPILMGKRLWKETRIGLFQQSVDSRDRSHLNRDTEPRVSFGLDWLKGSIAELYKQNISHHTSLFSNEIQEDSVSKLEKNTTPKLKALCLHNGTVYTWNRPCFGISENGKPHLRIENRYLASGPTLIDEVANAAFWLGLMMAMPEEMRNLPEMMSFDDARHNFYTAAQHGLDANIKWFDKPINIVDLLIKDLIPLARKGLESMQVNQDDINKYLGIIENRTISKSNGAQWMLRNFNAIKEQTNAYEASIQITRACHNFSWHGDPAHLWPDIEIDLSSTHNHFYTVRQIMKTIISTVNEEDLLELALNFMAWHKERYVMVENKNKELVGIIASSQILEILKSGWKENIIVKEIMVKNPVTVNPDESTSTALDLLTKNKIGCLPVTTNNSLVGLITERDIVDVVHKTQKFKYK